MSADNILQLPDTIIAKWQDIVDLLARLIKVPAVLIMRAEHHDIEVLVASRSEGNPYTAGERARLDTGLYCETVLRTNRRLLVADALQDPAWNKNPDIALGMVSYLGFPLHLPWGELFGTICVLDRKGNPYSADTEELLEQFQKVVEGDIAFYVALNEMLAEKERLIADMAKAQAKRENLLAESDRSRLALLNILEDQHLSNQRLQRLLEEKDILLREVHHRVKNNLQIIISLLNLQARQLGLDSTAAAALQTSQQRIRAIAAVHEKLYQSENLARVAMGQYIAGMARQLAAAYTQPEQRIQIETKIEDFVLGIDIALPIGLIVNELLTNALKHAFAGREHSRIDILLTHSAGRARLTVQDDGAGLPADVDEQSGGKLGMTLVRALARQIGGVVTITRGNGTAVTVDFSVEREDVKRGKGTVDGEQKKEAPQAPSSEEALLKPPR